MLGAKFINITRGRAPQSVQPGAEIQAEDTADFDEVMRQGNTLLVQLQGILKRIDAIVSLVEVGKGSIGKLLVDEELYNRLHRNRRRRSEDRACDDNSAGHAWQAVVRRHAAQRFEAVARPRRHAAR